MQRSTEIEDLVQTLFKTVSAGDGAAVEELLTGRDGLVFIGTDPAEWFTDRAAVRSMVAAQAGAGIGVEPTGIDGYEEGTVGWAAARGEFILPDGNRIPFRITAVFHREDGGWRMVQEHCSVPAPNEEVVGTEL